MTKTPKNGSSSSTPTPTGPASVGGGPGSGSNAPPSVGSTKSEGEVADNPIQNVDNRSGTPASLGSEKDHGTPGGGGNANPGMTTPVHGDPELNGSELCDNNPNSAQAGDPNSVPNNSVGGPPGGNTNPGSIVSENNDNVNKSGAEPDLNSVKQEGSSAEIKTENNDLAANPGSNQGQVQQNNQVDLPADAADLFDGFDTKDGVKDEAGNDTSDNLTAALTDFKEEDLKPFDDACNDFSNGKKTARFNEFFKIAQKIITDV